MSEELKPCPFCGGNRLSEITDELVYRDFKEIRESVMCVSCLCSVPRNVWNTRHPSAGLVPKELPSYPNDDVLELANYISMETNSDHLSEVNEPWRSVYINMANNIISKGYIKTPSNSAVGLDEKTEDRLCKLVENTEKEYDRQCSEGWPDYMIKKSRTVVRALAKEFSRPEVPSARTLPTTDQLEVVLYSQYANKDITIDMLLIEKQARAIHDLLEKGKVNG